MSGDEETAVVAAEVPPVADAPPSTVKETVLKKRKRDEQWAAVRKERQGIAKAKARSAGQGTFKRAEQYVREYRLQERDLVRFERESKKLKTISKFSESGGKLMFVIRIGGTFDMHPKSKKILQLLRLRQIYQGVFIKADKSTMSKLRMVEPYVTYGYPNLKSVTELIYKRGHGKVEREAVPLTGNAIIEEALGKSGIICIQDLVNEIYKVGPHFKDANNFLWPFKLNPPAAAGKRPGNPFVGSADVGNRGDKVNDLILRMN